MTRPPIFAAALAPLPYIRDGAIARERFLTNHRHLIVPGLFTPEARAELDRLLLHANWLWYSDHG